MKLPYVLLIVAGLGICASATAESVYKYTKDGKVIYSDQPPANANATRMESYSSKQPVTQPAGGSPPPANDERAALRSQECDKARARLVQYQNSPTLIQRNLKGEEITLSADERIDVIVRAQQDVNDLCGEPPSPEEAQSPAADNGENDLTADVELTEETPETE